MPNIEDFLESGATESEAEVSFYERPLFSDFCVFATRHIESGDIDPAYPVLKEVYRSRGYTVEQALWYTFLYVTWYNVGSAEIAFNRYPKPPKKGVLEPITLPPKKDTDKPVFLPTGTERRSFRGNDLAREHLNLVIATAQEHGSFENWVHKLTATTGQAGWDLVRTEFQKLKYAGPWASYKLADLLAHVHDYPITASDLGIGGASETAGPIPGMVRLTGYDWKRCATDIDLQKDILRTARDRGVPLSGLDQLETVFCDFNSLCKGAYYVGHDIDVQQGNLAKSATDFWEARKRVFDHSYLGELNGWSGVRGYKKGEYIHGGKL